MPKMQFVYWVVPYYKLVQVCFLWTYICSLVLSFKEHFNIFHYTIVGSSNGFILSPLWFWVIDLSQIWLQWIHIAHTDNEPRLFVVKIIPHPKNILVKQVLLLNYHCRLCLITLLKH